MGARQPSAPIFFWKWRRERDSNPRYRKRYNRFRVCRIRPLCHLSAAAEFYQGQVSFSAPFMYERSAAGTITEPSAFW